MEQHRGRLMKARIVDAAAAEFAEHGYAGSSIGAVADRVGSTKGLVTYHYPSKDALAADVIRAATDRVAAYDRDATPPRGIAQLAKFLTWLAAISGERVIVAALRLERELGDRSHSVDFSGLISERIETALIAAQRQNELDEDIGFDQIKWTVIASLSGFLQASSDMEEVERGNKMATWLEVTIRGISSCSE